MGYLTCGCLRVLFVVKRMWLQLFMTSGAGIRLSGKRQGSGGALPLWKWLVLMLLNCFRQVGMAVMACMRDRKLYLRCALPCKLTECGHGRYNLCH